MTSVVTRTISLESLASGIPVIQPDTAGFYNYACVVCLDSQNHSSGVRLHVEFCDQQEIVEVKWQIEVNEQIKRSFRDENKTTDFGACTLVLLLVRELSDYLVIEQSCQGTTIDYFLSFKAPNDDTLIFNNTAYLEVSGIRRQSEKNNVANRIREKVRRLNTPSDLPTLIAVVEFGQPHSVTMKI